MEKTSDDQNKIHQKDNKTMNGLLFVQSYGHLRIFNVKSQKLVKNLKFDFANCKAMHITKDNQNVIIGLGWAGIVVQININDPKKCIAFQTLGNYTHI